MPVNESEGSLYNVLREKKGWFRGVGREVWVEEKVGSRLFYI